MVFKKTIAAIVFLLLCLGTAQGGSPVWKITNDGDSEHTLFMGGTIHILGKTDYPLPQAFDLAYDKSQILVFETDIAKAQDPEFSRKLMSRMVYSDNRTLKQLISPSTLRDLNQFAGKRGISIDQMNQFKPGLVMIFLTLTEIERLGVAGIGVDEFYFEKGIQDQKTMAFLEAPEEQVDFLETIGQGNEDEMVAYILKDLGELPDLLPVIKKTWRTGDLEGLFNTTLAPLKKEYPDLYHSIMVKRNLNWMPTIQKMLTTPKVEFILVGAGHLAGDQGLLAQLRAKGYTAVNQ